MTELERNPQAVRQGAAAAVCIAAAGLAMPLIADRAAEQREDAQWSTERMAYAEPGAFVRGGDATTRVQLVSLRSREGLRGRGSAFVVANGFDQQALLVHAALRGPLPTPANAPMVAAGPDALNQGELRCMSEAIYYEARGESYRGQVAVAEVVMNRVHSPHYPKSVCSVVYQGSTRVTGCQFTFTCDGSLDRRPRGRAWERARNIAAQVLLGYTRPVTGRATHYHTNEISPVWSNTLVETARLGDHVFYRFPSRSERAALQAAYDRRRGARPAVDPVAPQQLPVDAITPEGLAPGVAAPSLPEPASAPVEDEAPAIDAVAPPTDETEIAT